MATPFTELINHNITLILSFLTDVVIVRHEERDSIAILEANGRYRTYTIHIREIWQDQNPRKYAYYILDGPNIITGFDNAPDPHALRLKYGDDYAKEHRLERIPHRHLANKSSLELTLDVQCVDFLNWIKHNLP